MKAQIFAALVIAAAVQAAPPALYTVTITEANELEQVVKDIPPGSRAVIRVLPGTYRVRTNTVNLLKQNLTWYFEPGAKLEFGSAADVDLHVPFNDFSGAVTSSVLGYAEFTTTNGGGYAPLYLQDASSRVVFHCRSLQAGSSVQPAVQVEAGSLDFVATDYVRSETGNAFLCGGTNAVLKITAENVYSGGPLIAANSVSVLGHSIWRINYAETVASATTETRALTLGTNVVMDIKTIVLGRNGDCITSQFATNEVGGIPGVLQNAVIYGLPQSTNGVINKAPGSSGWFGTTLTLKNCILHGPTNRNIISVETAGGNGSGLLTLENCHLEEGWNSTNWIDGGVGALVKVSGLTLGRGLPPATNVTLITSAPSRIAGSSAPVASAGSAPTNLFVAHIPPHQLTNVGSRVEVQIAGRYGAAFAGANTNSLVFGSETLLNTGSQASSNCAFTIRATITSTGPTSQSISASLAWGGVGTPYAQTNVVARTVQTNGISTALRYSVHPTANNGAITNEAYSVTYFPAQ